jgi:1-phosphofructokinase family hexose kinase
MIVSVTLNPSLDEWVTLPRLRPGRLNRAEEFARYPGGKGINVSRVAHELGHPTLAIALAGGHDGQILGELLRAGRIPARLIQVPGSTRNNYQLFSSDTRALTQINSPGPRISSTHLAQVKQALRRSCARNGCVVFSGSLPPGAPSGTYAQLLRKSICRGALTVLDASGAALRLGLKAKPWLIKPNQDEAEELLGMRLRTLAQAARGAERLLARGPSVVIISLGAAGAVLASRLGRPLRAVPPKVRVDSTVGAGDSLVAGFMAGWLKTHSLAGAFRLGVACGAATAMTPGTELCHRADVRRLLPRVRIR